MRLIDEPDIGKAATYGLKNLGPVLLISLPFFAIAIAGDFLLMQARSIPQAVINGLFQIVCYVPAFFWLARRNGSRTPFSAIARSTIFYVSIAVLFRFITALAGIVFRHWLPIMATIDIATFCVALRLLPAPFWCLWVEAPIVSAIRASWAATRDQFVRLFGFMVMLVVSLLVLVFGYGAIARMTGLPVYGGAAAALIFLASYGTFTVLSIAALASTYVFDEHGDLDQTLAMTTKLHRRPPLERLFSYFQSFGK